MCKVVARGALHAINLRERRGASGGEYSQIAVRAGYRDARAWSGLAKFCFVDRETGRLLTARGHELLLASATAAGITLPGDLTDTPPPSRQPFADS